jgi:hypothetical protein
MFCSLRCLFIFLLITNRAILFFYSSIFKYLYVSSAYASIVLNSYSSGSIFKYSLIYFFFLKKKTHSLIYHILNRGGKKEKEKEKCYCNKLHILGHDLQIYQSTGASMQEQLNKTASMLWKLFSGAKTRSVNMREMFAAGVGDWQTAVGSVD